MANKLKYLVLHCTATPKGLEVTAKDIRQWHTDPVSKGGRGWRQVGYTDMIHLNGKVERLVDNNEDNNVDPWEITNGAKGYNSVSRHVVYVGGGTSPEGEDTRTEAQRKALAEYVLNFHKEHPSVRIIGHNEIAGKACPSFDVPEFLREIGIVQ